MTTTEVVLHRLIALSPPTRSQERVRQFLEREKEGNLSFQKTELFIGASTAPVELTQATKGTLSIGDTVLVQHVGGSQQTTFAWLSPLSLSPCSTHTID